MESKFIKKSTGNESVIHTPTGKRVSLDQSRPYVTHHQILIVGAGTAGISVAASLRRKLKHSEIAVIDPAHDHFYQPLCIPPTNYIPPQPLKFCGYSSRMSA